MDSVESFCESFYLQMQAWLVTLLVTRQVKICVLDAQSHSYGLSTGCRWQVGRHVQLNWGEKRGYR